MKPSHRTPVSRWAPVTVALLLVLLAQPAWAYLDPGTGSMMISAIVGLFATAGLAIKTCWYKIRAFFRKNADDPPGVEDTAARTPVESESSADH